MLGVVQLYVSVQKQGGEKQVKTEQEREADIKGVHTSRCVKFLASSSSPVVAERRRGEGSVRVPV